jgi:hypothetical protein
VTFGLPIAKLVCGLLAKASIDQVIGVATKEKIQKLTEDCENSDAGWSVLLTAGPGLRDNIPILF